MTNADFARFIAAGCYHERRWWTDHGWTYIEHESRRSGRSSQDRITQPEFWNDPRYNGPIQPVVGISWYESETYCRWLTAQGHTQGWLPAGQVIRLPTWHEWERAARHSDQRPHPWGDAPPDIERANYQDTGIGRASPIGCFPGGSAVCGAQDMLGNVLEWTATPYRQPGQSLREKDFALDDRVLISWSCWGNELEYSFCGARYWDIPLGRISYLGFRLVQSLALIE